MTAGQLPLGPGDPAAVLEQLAERLRDEADTYQTDADRYHQMHTRRAHDRAAWWQTKADQRRTEANAIEQLAAETVR